MASSFRVRYCQFCNRVQILLGQEPSKPCAYCCGVHFDKQPRPQRALSVWDIGFLRFTCGIDPEGL